MRESASRYSTVSIILHWLIVLLVVANILVGMRMEEAEGEAQLAILGWHKSIGVTVVLVTLFRIGWRIAHPWPPFPADMAQWERLLARGTHIAFYVLLLVVPVLGWSTISAAGAPPIPIWGVIPWPNLPLPQSRDLAESLGSAHVAMVWLTLLVLVLHVAGALKHHFLDKDVVLHRMLPIVGRNRAAN